MKQGSTDDPFAEEPQDEANEVAESTEANGDHSDEDNQDAYASSQSSGSENETTDESMDTQKSLPFIYARDSVKDDRQQRPIFLRDDVEDGIPELVDKLESSFDENVYRTDVLEAAVLVAQQNPELVEEVLGEWGYGWH
ncbi:hypothetical protein [Halobacteriaceae bacterium SHR40]|uniref:hypothetical protein n=1 Tax=Halovenus amylolytica TaxID=2500550 RepID=UPI000FE3264E